MVIQEDLIFFLKNGKLKNINFGVNHEQLIETLGEPKDVSRHSWGNIFRYEDFEFYTWKEAWKNTQVERFFCFLVYAPEFYSGKGIFNFQAYGWTKNLSIEAAISFLNAQQIKFEERNEPDETDVRRICTEGNVFIQFRDWSETGKFDLYKYGRKVELNPIKPPTKQISFEIEKDFYNQLKEKAEETKISIANLCRDIIENHLEAV